MRRCSSCGALWRRMGLSTTALASDGHRDPHPEGQCSFRVRLQYPWMRTPDCSLKIEVTMAEPLLGPITDRPLIHSFSGETLNASVPCYSLAEIAAEKLRAFLQARRQLEQRGWSRNRPRDLYDLWHMHKQSEHQLDWEATGRMLPGKAQARAVSFMGVRTSWTRACWRESRATGRVSWGISSQTSRRSRTACLRSGPSWTWS